MRLAPTTLYRYVTSLPLPASTSRPLDASQHQLQSRRRSIMSTKYKSLHRTLNFANAEQQAEQQHLAKEVVVRDTLHYTGGFTMLAVCPGDLYYYYCTYLACRIGPCWRERSLAEALLEVLRPPARIDRTHFKAGKHRWLWTVHRASAAAVEHLLPMTSAGQVRRLHQSLRLVAEGMELQNQGRTQPQPTPARRRVLGSQTVTGTGSRGPKRRRLLVKSPGRYLACPCHNTVKSNLSSTGRRARTPEDVALRSLVRSRACHTGQSIRRDAYPLANQTNPESTPPSSRPRTVKVSTLRSR